MGCNSIWLIGWSIGWSVDGKSHAMVGKISSDTRVGHISLIDSIRVEFLVQQDSDSKLEVSIAACAIGFMLVGF